MSWNKASLLLVLLAAACSTAESMHDSSFTNTAAVPTMRHSLREMENYDNYRMVRLVDKELNMREADEDIFLRNAANVLEQTILVQPHFAERQTAVRELKSKLDQEDYVYILQLAADDLIGIAKTATAPSDQATVLVALQNLITEATILKREELKSSLQKIADAHLAVSIEAKHYAYEPMKELVSPSDEAQLALQNHAL